MSTSRRTADRGLDDPQSPVWDAETYLVPRSRSKRVVHACDGGEAVCRGTSHGVENGDNKRAKDSAVIPDGYFPVCTVCHRILTEGHR